MLVLSQQQQQQQQWTPVVTFHQRSFSYEECLKECGLTTLETRRLKGDQTEVFGILNGYENIYRNIFFSLKKVSRTRRNEDQC